MRLSPNGRRLIQEFEGFSAKAYRDADGWSIGYGHFLGKDPALASQTISRPEADALFEQDIAKYEAAVSLTTPRATQNEFDAMTSLTYNIGTGNLRDKSGGFAGSTVARLHNMGDRQGAADAFRMWKKSEGKDNPTLIRRREEERRVYLEGHSPSGTFPGSRPAQTVSPAAPPVITANDWTSFTPAAKAGAGGALALALIALGWLVYRSTH